MLGACFDEFRVKVIDLIIENLRAWRYGSAAGSSTYLRPSNPTGGQSDPALAFTHDSTGNNGLSKSASYAESFWRYELLIQGLNI
ncbi:MAG: hypothetical protein QOH06_1164 [Acidobacteriota bacterium]|jgi:hypothetical protein|nr:hypothetical protein [Acidobacteriota bacterium]